MGGWPIEMLTAKFNQVKDATTPSQESKSQYLATTSAQFLRVVSLKRGRASGPGWLSRFSRTPFQLK